MRLRNFQTFQHAFTYRYAGHDNHKLLPAVELVQFVNRTQIDIGFARTRFHFQRKIQPVRADFRFRLPVLLLYRIQIPA